MAKLIRIKRSRSSYRSNKALLKGVTGLLDLFFFTPLKRSRAEELQQARIAKLEQDREIGEINLATKANQLLLQDIKIEAKQLELLALKRKLGDPDGFAPPTSD